MEVCPPFSDIALGPRGPASVFEALETLVHLSRAQFLCRAAESEARYGRVTLRTGFSGRHQPPPYCLVTHVREAALSGVGVQTPGWDFTVCQQSLCPDLHLNREEGGGCSWQRAYLSAQYILSQLWETMHVSTKLPTRERRPRITPILASSACDFNTKTNHIPRTCLPTLLTLMFTRMLLYNKIPLERGFSFFHFGPGYNEMINFLTNFHCVY